MKYKLSEKEQFGVELFKDNHKCDTIQAIEKSKLGQSEKKGIIDSFFEVESKGTGILIVTVVTCYACEEEFNVTDYDEG